MNIVIIKHALKLLQGQKCPPSHGIKEQKEKNIIKELENNPIIWGQIKMNIKGADKWPASIHRRDINCLKMRGKNKSSSSRYCKLTL